MGKMKNIVILCCAALLPTMTSGFGLPAVTTGCPGVYRRFSSDHSFCKPKNPQCQVLRSGLDPKYIPEIVYAHNHLRNYVASGHERRAGGLPTAANMLELTWDEELAAVAQKWVEQCYFEHNCWECRNIRAFPVGQSLAWAAYNCEDRTCFKDQEWTKHIMGFYDEVEFFDKNMVKSLVPNNIYLHFVGVCFAETYKIGCGYIAYIEDGFARQLYVCHYGPAAFLAGERMYQEGPPCSKCPENSCCGESCGEQSFPSLCRLKSTPPKYIPKKTSLFLCQFEWNDGKCRFSGDGPDEWHYEGTVAGTYLELIAREGSVNKAYFTQQVKLQGESCFILTHRKGPQVAGTVDQSSTEIELEVRGKPPQTLPVVVPSYFDFIDALVPIKMNEIIKFTIKFSVPESAPSQYLEIKRIEITAEGCGSFTIDPFGRADKVVGVEPPPVMSHIGREKLCSCANNPLVTVNFCKGKLQ